MSDPKFPLRATRPQQIAVWLASGLGLGLIAPAPGTAGTLVWGLPLAWAVSQLPGVMWQTAAICVLIAFGIPLTTSANRAIGVEKDHQAIVWDEIVSMPVVFLLVPMSNWRIAVAGFALHRLFDIAKPPPARQLERLPEGLGVMADDLMAALYAAALLWLLVWIDQSAAWRLLAAGAG